MALVLGIDGGGSSTRAVLAETSGNVVGRGLAGASNPVSMGPDAAIRAIDQAVSRAWSACGRAREPAAAAFLGVAGAHSPADRDGMAQIGRNLQLAHRVAASSDLHIALSGGVGSGPGVVLIAGTGSACYARNAAGENVTVGGKGWLAGDSGSAYWVAHRALRAAVRQWDGRWDRTRLGDAVLGFLGLSDPSGLSSQLATPALSPAELARLCPQVLALAKDGDQAAKLIVNRALDALTEMVQTAVRRVGLVTPSTVLAGGLALATGFSDRLREHIRSALPAATFPDGVLAPVGGAVLEAAYLAGETVGTGLTAQLRVLDQ